MDGSQRYWFQYFPENFMWSQGMMIAIEMARWSQIRGDDVARMVYESAGTWQGADRLFFRRTGQRQGIVDPVRRCRACESRHSYAGDRRTRTRRGVAPAEHPEPLRLRSACC